ncbi:hypothetical protein M501DRAFT_933916 [Patellaria atrata CBS 101060]|uniref:RING-type domain-containing protein n=1 Tax=Patellaria atrata CBS 101060 TaxID=1346257 RepID=A0A9P4SC96_9PEZI|nr:hypothetical protein M501DRAFT_933916 [Patellaria atrata CBS 101060]
MARGNYESASAREIRQKSRIARLNSLVQTQAYHDWSLSQQDKLPPDTMKTHPICVICLDTIEDAAQIRGLGCLHVFHQTCLDDWFTRMNEFCPLCHRPIVPPDPKTKGRKLARIRTHLPAGTMV